MRERVRKGRDGCDVPEDVHDFYGQAGLGVDAHPEEAQRVEVRLRVGVGGWGWGWATHQDQVHVLYGETPYPNPNQNSNLDPEPNPDLNLNPSPNSRVTSVMKAHMSVSVGSNGHESAQPPSWFIVGSAHHSPIPNPRYVPDVVGCLELGLMPAESDVPDEEDGVQDEDDAG